MASPAKRAPGNGMRRRRKSSAAGKTSRHSILDFSPLELDCMNALWPLEQATVRQVQQSLAEKRPRAYTTIMTILDRLAQKHVVLRRKVGRAWVYRPRLSARQARSSAVARLIEGFFNGSREALALHVTGHVTGEDQPRHASAAGRQP